MMTRVFQALERFRIELPSWGFANTGTRFGKFLQPAAAVTTEEKLADAGEVHKLTGVCPTVALHVLWDLPNGLEDLAQVAKIAERYGVLPGSINPNLFQNQEYKYGSFGNPDAGVRGRALQHVYESIAIAQRLQSRDISLWFADGSNYPGTANMRRRKRWFEEVSRSRARATESGAASVDRIQTVRAGLLPHRYRRLGHGSAYGARRRTAGQSAGGYGPSLRYARTSSRSSRGCLLRICSAAFTSTTGVTPMTT